MHLSVSQSAHVCACVVYIGIHKYVHTHCWSIDLLIEMRRVRKPGDPEVCVDKVKNDHPEVGSNPRIPCNLCGCITCNITKQLRQVRPCQSDSNLCANQPYLL